MSVEVDQEVLVQQVGPNPAESTLLGKTLRHYKVVEPLGQGGMGEVWVAEDLHLERRIALKVLPASASVDTASLLRFEQEAKAVAALQHPNIVTLHSIEEAQGVRFMTMELVAGRRLDQEIPAEGMSISRFLELAVQISDAVAAAHAKGITHRDLKPANVVLTEDGRPKVLDFGLAELRREPSDGDRAPDPDLTATATHVASVEGTVPYMSPEQLSGIEVDSRSDVFSLGVLFYEMLAGCRPFDSKSPIGLMASILRDEPQALTALRSSIPPELSEIIQRCLSKDPEQRYAEAGALHDALRSLQMSWLSGTSTAMGRSSGRRSWLRAALISGSVAVLVATVSWVLWAGKPSADPTVAGPRAAAPIRIAVRTFENLGGSEDNYFAAGVTEEIRSRLASVRGLAVVSRASVDRAALASTATAQVGQALDVDYLVSGSVRWDRTGGQDRVRVTPTLVRTRDETQVWSETYDRVLEDIFQVQSEVAEAVIRQLDLTLFPTERDALVADRPTENLAAYQAYLRAKDHFHDNVYARQPYDDGIRELDRAVGLDPKFALAWAELSQAHSMLYHLGHDRTPERRELALTTLDRAFALAPEEPEVRFARGYYRYRIEKDYPGALEDFRAVLDQLPSASDGFQAVAYVLRRQGDMEGGADNLARALALDPRSGLLTTELANTQFLLRHYAEANRLFDEAILLQPNSDAVYRSKAQAFWMWHGNLEGARASLEAMPHNDDAANIWTWFFQNFYEGDAEGALKVLQDAPELLLGTYFAHPADLLRGQLFEWAGRENEARQAYGRAASQLREALRASPGDARLQSALGIALAGLGDREGAIEAARHGVELMPVSLDAAIGPDRLFELTLVYTRVGDFGAALDTARQFLTRPGRGSKKLMELDPRFALLVKDPRFQDLPGV